MRLLITYILIPVKIIVMISSCNKNDEYAIMLREARQLMESGSYTLLLELSGSLIDMEDIDAGIRREIDSLADYARRYMIDFPHTADDISERLRSDSVEAGELDMREWEDAGQLEFMWIDGERRYFRWAHRNLYRINDSLRARMQVDRQRNESLAGVCISEIREIIDSSSESGYGRPVNPKIMKIDYSITVDADAVPPGEIIRCWMPFPREDSPRQDHISLNSSEPAQYKIAPVYTEHRSIYFEKAAVKGEPTVFSMELEFRSRSQFFDPAQLSASTGTGVPDDLTEYTEERLPHISFSDEVSQLAASLVTDGMGPYEKVRVFYRWINDNIIWTSAVEYGLMPDIPAYVLENGRGDCGMQTLLFLSLCRYAGIPAKWQSGWMMHPGHVNLHDWSEVWIESAGWVPVDVSFKLQPYGDSVVSEFYMSGMDSYRLIVNDDYGRQFYPTKHFPRSEPLDFQRGELEWDGGNIYFDKWRYSMEVEYK